MPYKNPERKRQWEREHREERNARRRTAPGAQVIYAPANQKSENLDTIAGLVLGLVFVLIALFAAWRSGRALEPISN